MALTPDQEKQLNDHLLPGFVPPPSSYDVNTQGPNLDSTLKMASTPPPNPSHGASGSWNMEHEPVSMSDIPAAVPQMEAPIDTAVKPKVDDETNPKVASSHPGFNSDDLDRYLSDEKTQMDKYGADKQAADFDSLRGRQHSVGNQIGRGLASMGDGIMQGVAQQGNPNFLEHMDQNQARQLATQTEANKGFNEANMAGIKAKEGLDRQTSSNPLGASAAQAMIPMLKQVYPGKTDAEYAEMAHNPAVAEALLPEGVKLAEGDKKIQAAHEERMAAREYQNGMREELRQDRLERQAQTSLSSIRGDASLKNVETQRDAAIQAYNRISQIEKSGKAMNPIDYVDVLGQIYKARTGTAPTEVILASARQATLKGDAGKAYTYLTGQQAPGTTPAIMASLKEMTRHMGQQADQLHDGYMRSHGASAFPAGLNAEAKERLGAQGRGLSFAEATGVGNPATDRVPTVADQASYDALPVGAKYLGPDGTSHTKKR